jgi:hypothetical protein
MNPMTAFLSQLLPGDLEDRLVIRIVTDSAMGHSASTGGKFIDASARGESHQMKPRNLLHAEGDHPLRSAESCKDPMPKGSAKQVKLTCNVHSTAAITA